MVNKALILKNYLIQLQELESRKPIAYYETSHEESLAVGQRALVFGVKHHNPRVLGSGWVLTSNVVKILDKVGSFETENTTYIKRNSLNVPNS